MELSDLLLIERYKLGDIVAFDLLMNKYEKKIYNYCYRMLNNFEEAKDLTQEIFVKVFKNIEKFRGESSFYTWLYRIAHNLAIDFIRKRSRENVVSNDQVIYEDGPATRDFIDMNLNPEMLAADKERKELVIYAINKLLPEYKEVIVLRDIQGLSVEETAKILKCAEGTVKSRLHRARFALKNIWKSMFEEDKKVVGREEMKDGGEAK